MRMRLPAMFVPYPGWDEYCQYALSVVHQTHGAKSTLLWNSGFGAYELNAGPDVQACYFKVDEIYPYCDAEAQLARWTINLGGARLLEPFAERTKTRSGKDHFILRALFSGTNLQSGLFRVFAKMLRHSENIPSDMLASLRAFADTLKED